MATMQNKNNIPQTPALPDGFDCNIKGLDTHRITLCNGLMTQAAEVEGLRVCCFKDFTAEEKAPISRVFKQDITPNTLVVRLFENHRLDKPLQLVNLCIGNEPLFLQPHCLVLLEKGASLHIVHCIDSHPQARVETNALTEIHMEAGARLEYIQMQNVGNACKVSNRWNAQLQEAAQLSMHLMTLNGGNTQNEAEIHLNEPHAKAEVFGLYLQDKDQRVSNNIRINHLAPQTFSRELFKGVLDDAARSYFKGHVYVASQAAQTEAYQTNRNLLVSGKAQAHAKPYLEIYADDVQCNHGVTVGQLDEEALFYMRCRGIPAEAARRLLMGAYADEILKQIGVESLRLWLNELVKKRFSGRLEACSECVLDCPDGSC